VGETRVIRLVDHGDRPDGLEESIDILRSGGVAAGPTETFYGLMASAGLDHAIERVADLKGREADKPLLLLIDRPERAADYAETWPEAARLLAGAFWPGPLTLLVPARKSLNPWLVGPGGRVGLRVCGLPLVRSLAAGLDAAVTGTSANPAGLPPAVSADEAAAYFTGRLDLIIDAGPCPGGEASTIVDVSARTPRLIRAGRISPEALRAVVPDVSAVSA